MAKDIQTAAKRPARFLVGAQSNDYSAQLADVSPERFFNDAEVFARTQLLNSEYDRLDRPINFWDVYNIEAEALGQPVIYPVAEHLEDIAFEIPERESFAEFQEKENNNR